MKRSYCCKIIVLLLIFILPSCSFSATEHYMFADINECILLEQNAQPETQFYPLDAKKDDSSVAQLSYVSSYATKLVFDKCEAELFAYKFETAAEAKEYFHNVTGKPCDHDTNYSTVRGVRRYRIVVIDNENAYKITTSSHDVTHLNQWLKNNFSLKIVVVAGDVKTITK